MDIFDLQKCLGLGLYSGKKWRRQHYSLSGRLSGVSFFCEFSPDDPGYGKNFSWNDFTFQIRAEFPWHGPKAKLLREGTFRAWLRSFGYQDIQIGHDDIDFRLIIKGTNEEQIRKVMQAGSPYLSPLLANPCFQVPQIDGQNVRLQLVGIPSPGPAEMRAFVQMRDAVVAMASVDLCGAKFLQSLPGANPIPGKSSPYRVELKTPRSITLEPIHTETGTYRTMARTATRHFDTSFVCKTSDVSSIESLLQTTKLESTLKQVGFADLYWDSTEVGLKWDGVVESEMQLLAGVRFLSDIANEHKLGPYR